MKYTHSSVANVTALIAAIGADLVTEGWTAHATVVDAWTSAADTYGYRFSVLFSEDTEGNIQASTFVDTLPSDNTSPVIIGTRGSGFTASRNWSVYAYASGFMAFDQTETSSHDEGFFGAGRYAPLHAGQGYWEPERLWNLGCRVEDSATAYSLFISGGDIATTPTHRALVVSGGGTADWAEFAGFVTIGSLTLNRALYGAYDGATYKHVVSRGILVTMLFSGATYMTTGIWLSDDCIQILPKSGAIPSQGDTFTLADGDVFEIPPSRAFLPTTETYMPILALKTAEGS
jgi:hypothetical protein